MASDVSRLCGFQCAPVWVCVCLSVSCVCVCVCVSCLGAGAGSGTGLQALCLTSSGLLPLMISFFDWDPGNPEHSAQTNSTPNREPCTHSLKSSTVSSGQLTPWRLCAIRQSYTLMMLNIVYMELEMAIPDDWDPGDPEQSAYSNSMPDRDTRAQFDVFYRLFWSIASDAMRPSPE